MANKSFVAFVAIFIFVIVSFGLAFHLAFGLSVFEFRDIERSFITLVDFTFGDISANFEERHRFFGPAFFLVFTFGSSFILTVIYNFLDGTNFLLEYVYCCYIRCLCWCTQRTQGFLGASYDISPYQGT